MTAEENFVVNLGISLDTDESQHKSVSRLVQELEWVQKKGIEAGKTLDFIERTQQRILRDATTYASSRAWDKFQENTQKAADKAAEKEKREQLRKYREEKQAAAAMRDQFAKGMNLANPFAFITPKAGVNLTNLFNRIGQAAPQLQFLGQSFSAARSAWNFAEAVGELGAKILRLGETSGMSAQRLTDLGAAVSAFGGSAASVASGNERFIKQIEALKRGGGLGYLGDLAYKYGFQFDINSNWEANTRKAIEHARKMLASGDEGGAMMFLREFDSSNYSSNIMKARRSAKEVDDYEGYFKSFDNLGDQQAAAQAGQEYAEAVAQAQRAWQAITNQLAAAMLPIMSRLVSFFGKIAESIAKSKAAMKAIKTVIGAMIGLMTTLIAKAVAHAIAWIATAFAQGKFHAGIAGAAALAMGGIGVLAWGIATMAKGKKKSSEGSSDSSSGNNANMVSVYEQHKLSAREKYILNEQVKTAGISANGQNLSDLSKPIDAVAQKSNDLCSIFSKLWEQADKTRDSFKEVAAKALSVWEAQRQLNQQTMQTQVSNQVSNSTSTTTTTVEVTQTFNGADSDTIREGSEAIRNVLPVEEAARKFK